MRKIFSKTILSRLAYLCIHSFFREIVRYPVWACRDLIFHYTLKNPGVIRFSMFASDFWSIWKMFVEENNDVYGSTIMHVACFFSVTDQNIFEMTEKNSAISVRMFKNIG